MNVKIFRFIDGRIFLAVDEAMTGVAAMPHYVAKRSPGAGRQHALLPTRTTS